MIVDIPSCIHCGARGQGRFCSSCGTPQLWLCPGCGKEIHVGARFCYCCGHSVIEPKSPPLPFYQEGQSPESSYWKNSKVNPALIKIRLELEEVNCRPFLQTYCSFCGQLDRSFDATFRCNLCWELFLCRTHQVEGEFGPLCPLCMASLEEGLAARELRSREITPPKGTFPELIGQPKSQEKTGSCIQDLLEDMILVPGGEFLMGDERRPVYVEPFYIERYPVTNAQFQQFDPSHDYPKGRENYPASRWVSWYRARAYARWIGKRLPTEAEWEKAARGTDGRLYPWGDRFDPNRCNTKESRNLGFTPVDRYPQGQSPYGCYDMAGNVLEWTADWFDDRRSHRVVKSGSWDDFDFLSRCANRMGYEHFCWMTMIIGFRCVKSP